MGYSLFLAIRLISGHGKSRQSAAGMLRGDRYELA